MYTTKKVRRHFFFLFLWSLYASQKKTNDIFGILTKYWARNICLLCKNIDLKIRSYLTWVWPDIRQKSYWMTLWDQMAFSLTIHLQNDPENVCRMACLWLSFYGYLLWPDLDLYKYGLRTHALPFVAIYQHFGWVWATYSPSYRPESPKCENAPFWHLTWPWPDTWP